MCGSGGASIALLSVKHLPPDVRFKRVVFASAAVSVSRNLKPLTDHTEEGLYNYYSHKDYTLVGIIAGFLFTIKFDLGWPAAGRFGYRPGYPNWSLPIKQLGWQEEIKLDNSGSHLDCYDQKFFEKYFLPLFAGKLPQDDPVEWTPEVLSSYEQPDRALP